MDTGAYNSVPGCIQTVWSACCASLQVLDHDYLLFSDPYLRPSVNIIYVVSPCWLDPQSTYFHNTPPRLASPSPSPSAPSLHFSKVMPPRVQRKEGGLEEGG